MMSCYPPNPRSDPPLELAAVTLPAPIGEQIDLPAWLCGVADLWILEQLPDARSTDPWKALVFVGRLARLAELHATAADRRAAVRRLLQGERDPRHEGPRRWARAWTGGTRRAVRQWMQFRLDELVCRLEKLEGRVAVTEPAWRRAMLAALRARDDLEGIALLLVQSQDEPEVLDALQQADERGEALAKRLGGSVGFEHEQLRRAGAIELHGPWWTRFSKERLSWISSEPTVRAHNAAASMD